MTAIRKRLICGISIVLLAAVLVAGIFVSALANKPIVPDAGISVSDTDFVSAQTSVKTDGELAEGSVAISSARALRSFLQGDEPNGHLTADVALDWSGEVGSDITFESGRTLDGRGYKITLSDAEAKAQVSDEDDDASHKNSAGKATDTKYALFVKYNRGIIKNVNFVYNASVSIVNDGKLARNSVGIVCAENTGRIEHCDFNVSGEYKFYYITGSSNDSSVFATEFGGIAGRNGGVITHISARYENFSLRVRTKARRSSGIGSVDAKTLAGGIAGIMTDANAECSNIIILGNEVTFRITADRNKGSFGNDGTAYRQAGSVVSGNSSYSHGTDAIVNNIISDFSMSLPENVTDASASSNAIVHCGKVTNATILDKRGGGINMQLDNCDCGTSGNAGTHEINYPNIIELDKWTRVTLSFSDDGKQIVDFKPINGWIETHSFTKNVVDSMGKYADGSSASISADNNAYDGVPENSSSTDFDEEWKAGKVFEIEPYQTSGKYFWELKGTSWRYAQLEFNPSSSLGYTGGDLLKDFVRFRFDNPNFNDFYEYDLAKMTMRNNGARIYKAEKLGDYYLTVAPIEVNGQQYIYYDESDHIVVPVPENYDASIVHKYSVVLGKVGQIQSTGGWINDNILLELENGVDGAFDGFVYTVNGSKPWIKEGRILSCMFDSSSEGRTYTLYLTKDGVRMTDDYTFNVKVDVSAPTVQIETLNPLDGTYYTENSVTFKVSDGGSGVASVKFDGVELSGTDGVYNAAIPESGEYLIEVEDLIGNYNSYTLNALIDSIKPTVEVFATVGGEEYTSGANVNSIVTFGAQATYGISGGEIQFSIDGGDWQTYVSPFEITENADVTFRAISKTKDSDGAYLVTDPVEYQVRVEMIVLEITADWFELGSLDKVYDGKTSLDFTPDWSMDIMFSDYFDYIDFIIVEANYESSDVGSGIPVRFTLRVDGKDHFKVVNKISGIYGNILKRDITVDLQESQAVYGDGNVTYQYTVAGAAQGDDVKLEFANNLRADSQAGEYRYWLAKGEYDNYTVTNFADINSELNGAKLTLGKAVVSRLIYNADDLVGLDTDRNIASINVKFESNEEGNREIALVSAYKKMQSDGSYVDVEAIDGAGYYLVSLSVPEEYAGKYRLSDNISSFVIRVIDASIYDTDVQPEVPPIEIEGDDEAISSVSYYFRGQNVSYSSPADTDGVAGPAKDYAAIAAIFSAVVVLLSILAAVCIKLRAVSKNKK